MTETTEVDQAAARVEAFLPDLADIPDETIAAQLGAAQLAADIRVVLRHRRHLAERLARAEGELAEAREDQEWLGYLEQAGIDNSPAYDYACQLRREARAAAAEEAKQPIE